MYFAAHAEMQYSSVEKKLQEGIAFPSMHGRLPARAATIPATQESNAWLCKKHPKLISVLEKKGGIAAL